MKEYHKIQTVFKRDPQTNRIIEGEYSLPEFEYLKDNPWEFTEKVDGTNIRVMFTGEDVSFGGKTDNAQIPSFLITRLNELFYTTSKKQLLKEMFGNADGSPVEVCLYGEGYGHKIQGEIGTQYLGDKNDFVLFDVKVGDVWLERPNVEDIATKLGVRAVPIIGYGTIKEAVEIVRKGYKSQWGDFMAEGLVARPTTELRTRMGHRLITKIKHRDFFDGGE